jgi:hypothetical protein
VRAAVASPVSRETAHRDRSDEIAPTRAMAELLGMRAPEPLAELFMTQERVTRFGGIRQLGYENADASTGSNKNKRREIKKDTVNGRVERDNAGNVINDVGREGLPVTTPGMYKHPSTGVMYQVKLGRESHKPFALTESGEYAKGIIFELRAADKVAVEIPGLGITVPVTPAKLEEGFYQLNDEIYRVKYSRAGYPFALHITDDEPKGIYVPGVVKQITPEMKLTRELAADYGIRTGNCCICGRTLTKAISVQKGIGPICEGRMGW